MNGRGLDIGGDDDSVLPQVQLERVPGPAPFRLHDIERDASEKILEGRPDPDAVPLQWFEPGRERGDLYPLQEFYFGERTACVRGFVREEVRDL